MAWAFTKREIMLDYFHVLENLKYAYIYKVKVKLLSPVQFFASPWTVAYQTPPSMEFSRQEYWSGLPFPSPGDLPDPGIKPRSSTLQPDALPSEPPGKLPYVYKFSHKSLENQIEKHARI